MAPIQKVVRNAPRPVPPRYRLIDVANIIPDPDIHWQTGLRIWGFPPTGDWPAEATEWYEGGVPDQPSTWALCTSDGTSVKPDGTEITLPEFDTFTVVMAETCTARSVFGEPLPDETPEAFAARQQQLYVDRAMASFAASESWAVEREFSQGLLLPGNPHLSDPNATILPTGGAAQDPRTALSYLNNAIGQTGQQGIIHADPAVLSAWGEFYIRPEGNMLVTIDGVPIVRGAGYIGAVPDNAPALADGQSYAFATNMVDIRRSEAFVTPERVDQALDRHDNTITYRVERTYAVDWDTVLQAAVLVDWKI